MRLFTHDELIVLIQSIPIGATEDNADMKSLADVSVYNEMRTLTRSIYFAQDRLDIWELLRPHPQSGAAIHWVREHLQNALQDCPLLMGHWAHFSQDDALTMVHEVGKFIDDDATITDLDRLAILRGQVCDKYPALGALFRFAVTKDPEHFSMLSPAWLGVKDSELRQEALSCGWEPDSLAVMCCLHASRPSAVSWVAQWPFAYTMMLLQSHIDGGIIPQSGVERNQSGQSPIAIQDSADARDTVVARALLPYLDSFSRKYFLTWPPSMVHPEALLPPGEAVALTQLVDVHMGLGMAQTLLDHFTQQSLMHVPDGKMLCVKKPEGLELPEMGAP